MAREASPSDDLSQVCRKSRSSGKAIVVNGLTGNRRRNDLSVGKRIMRSEKALAAIGLVLSVLASLCLVSCGASAQHRESRVVGTSELDPAPSQQTCGLSELTELWQQRKTETSGDFAIGPGDVIRISVPELDELQNQEVRVSSNGTIGLSLIGTMQVGGLDENQLRAALVKRLGKFMKYPRVELFVKRYQTREVAVTGAVQKPGRYDLANMDQSILDMIGRAGGTTADSAQKVIFVPEERGLHAGGITDSNRNAQLASRNAMNGGSYRSTALEENPQHPFGDSSAESALKGRNWIVINLGNPQTHGCLGIPTRPGDVIIVPVAGEVMVQGWVKQPGAFKITPGMTVLGAVSAAGGASFSTSAELLRSDSAGKHVTEQFNLSDLASGTETDVPVQSGDVVIVQPSIAGAIPYTLLQIFNRFGGGFYLPIP